MSFRNRPVLDRKHRPRWQDELRSQQLIVAGFALAIAVAVGIFAAASWSSYYQANLRQSALVGGTAVERGDLVQRIDIVAAELQATYADLSEQSGGARDEIIQQQLRAIEQAFNSIQQQGADSLVTGLALEQQAGDYGVAVTDAELDAEVASRRTLPDRKQVSMIMAFPKKDEGASADDPPTDKNWADAKARVDAIKEELDGGGDFAAIARERSDDASKAKDGLIGWVQGDDAQFGEYFTAAADAEVGDVVGPIRNDRGWYLLKVNEARPAADNATLKDLLGSAAVSDDDYRDYVRQELIRERYQAYFSNTIVTRYQPQRKVSQIRVDNDTGVPGPKVKIRHLLVAPLPGEEDQSVATDAEWRAALREARALRREAVKPDADWTELAKESDDPGSRSRGGVLGWYDLGTLGQQFVPEFASEVGRLELEEVSLPVRSDFGYHVIQVTDRRATALDFAERLASQVKDDPDSFADVAIEHSDDSTTSASGGDLGWVVHYQLDAARDQAIFDLTEPGQISEPVVTPSAIYIFKLDDTSESRFVSAKQRTSVSNTGFARWLDELKSRAGVWLDAEFAPSTATAA
jgi:parvulin-like peptidyl-prolyl isomerase